MFVRRTSFMIVWSLLLLMFSYIALLSCSGIQRQARISGELKKWHTVTLDFQGPRAAETDTMPNPFLDYRLQVLFTGPDGQEYNVPGYFAGDGAGGEQGKIWRVRFTPDERGIWTYEAAFLRGEGIAVSLLDGGEPVGFDGARGEFTVSALDTTAPGFLKWGRLEYVGEYYLKFRDGDYWIKGGTDTPENFLGYAGFDNTREYVTRFDGLEITPNLHTYAAHVDDWQPGDPDWGDGAGKGIIGALNYLASRHVNSLYFLVMNIGGDGKDVFPWTGTPDPEGSISNDNLHFDNSRLRQWETVFNHAQRKGIFLHFVFNEAEEANKRELDDGELGTERKLYYREIIARFGHHPALEWNLCEEYNLNFNFGPDRIREFAEYIQYTDPYDHPIAVHSAGNPLEQLAFTFGDSLFDMLSVQLNQRRIDQVTEGFRRATAQAGKPVPASMDEFTVDMGGNESWIPIDNAELQRKQKIWPTYFSGGNIEFILEGFLSVDTFKTPEREKLWNYLWYARRFMQQQVPFPEMIPADDLVTGESTIPAGTGGGESTRMGAQVFALFGSVYAVYLPSAQSTGVVDLEDAKGEFTQRWYNPRTGEFEGAVRTLQGGRSAALGPPPHTPGEDWVVLVRQAE
ncbi:MAG TPA: DUF5060 domain-containing protein [bacterium]|nr:DUF5060 domain-containing protein [bacterium]